MARSPKLKVFRTAIGFHDAYVAAPSQKAALEAWGSRHNLFAAKAAEIVAPEDAPPGLLDRPGEVVRVSRGGLVQQLKALDERPGTQSRAEAAAPADALAPDRGEPVRSRPRPARRRKPKPMPSRAALDKAEQALAQAKLAAAAALGEIDRRSEALAREREKLVAAANAQRARLDRAIRKEQERYNDRLRAWAARE